MVTCMQHYFHIYLAILYLNKALQHRSNGHTVMVVIGHYPTTLGETCSLPHYNDERERWNHYPYQRKLQLQKNFPVGKTNLSVVVM